MNNRYTKELLEPIIKNCTTWADVCRQVGVTPISGAQSHIKKRAKDFGINFSHFVGKSSTKGKTFPKKDAINYCFKGSKVNSSNLRNKLIRDGYKKKECEICKLTKWRGEDIPLELDHLDSDHFNNEITNLQIICANCHSLETKKRKMAK
jgi:hypothetical protein